MFDQVSRREVIAAAAANNIEPAALLAVAEVESAGIPFWSVGGRKEPAIRFEGHIFFRLLGERNKSRQQTAVAQGLAKPLKSGRVPNPENREKRYALLERAKNVDIDAAIESTSWGLGQVMGFHWRAFGLRDARHLESIARSGVGGQIDLMIRFIRMNKLMNALNGHDWHAFARVYNGKGYREGGYHTKMANAYTRHQGAKPEGGAGGGMQGSVMTEMPPEPDVRAIQVMLTNLGYNPGPVDGDWGPLTSAGLLAFQKRNGLPQTGQPDPETLARLQSGGQPMVDPKAAGETEADLAAKGSETIKLSRRGRLMAIAGMIAGALGFGGENGFFSGLGDGYDNLAGQVGGTSSGLSEILSGVGQLFGSEGNQSGLWIGLAGLAFMYFRNSKAVANRRVEDHQKGWNTKY